MNNTETPTGTFISNYRGYEIWQEGVTSFALWHNGYLINKHGSIESCKWFIAELLQP